MKKRRTKYLTLLLTLVMVMAVSSQLHSLTIKIGSIVPARSPWDKALRELSRKWSEITGGLVKLKIYPGGIAGSEFDTIRKMRMGILGGAVLSNHGFTLLYPDVYALNTPFIMKSDEELEYVMGKMMPVFEEGVEKKGYKVVIFTSAGWLHFFTKKPINYPEDLKKHKLAFTPDEPQMEQAWKKSGYHIVPTELKDTMMALQSGMVDSFYLPPLLAGSGQYFPLAPNMCTMPIAPLVGGIVIPQKVWKRIPDKYKEEMMKAAAELTVQLAETTIKLEKETIETMVKHGLKIRELPGDAMPRWRAAAAKGMDQLIGKAFSKEMLDRILQHIEDFRGQKNQANKTRQ
ncbi:MAG: C4-dicarboxylate ABC transporter substrate-binding protein [bacterium]|nr:C4-dicarboxylate ABC transporter substrate-binding protein [bacterium]